MMRRLVLAGFLFLCSLNALAAERITIHRTTAPVTVDGDLSDPAWQNATKFETWYETNPGDNVPAPVKNVGYVTYDDRFFYVGFDLEDPQPNQIRAPYADHDAISGNSDDFAGIIIDTRNDGKTALDFFVTARNVQYDAVQDDGGAGEDNSPDFFWDSATKIHARGWSMEMRIPFSSLRYDNANPEQWGLILYRNWPRDRRVQMFTSKLPRDSNCFVCNFAKIDGLRDLPSGDHMVLAPYVTANQQYEPVAGGLRSRPFGGDAGLDFKWSPTADTVIDATINPDFSQIESDVAVISTNERFAIFISEKRPFFLEGVELFSTPIQAVYTRTITSPRFGGRTTGRIGAYSYTMLVAQDRGGGDIIIPTSTGSGTAFQDFSSTAFVGRVRRDVGKRSFVSLLATARESEGDAHNRVFGPDFQFRIGERHTLTGQFLYSATRTPLRTDLHGEWNGQKLNDHAAHAWYAYATDKVDFFANYSDYGDDFRADNGFVPQVGYRGSYAETGRTWRPKGFFNRVRLFTFGEYQNEQDGDPLYRLISAGVGADGRRRSFWRFRYAHDEVRSGNRMFGRDRVYYTLQAGLSRVLSNVSISGWIGDEVDFFRGRLGRGASVDGTATIRPNDHLQIGLTTSLRWLNINDDRLFTSQVERIRATYTFNSRMFVRAILQNQRTNRDRELHDLPETAAQHIGGFATQLLFAYKLNWQTVFFLGAGDLRSVTPEEGDFEQGERQIFAKVSYAFQR